MRFSSWSKTYAAGLGKRVVFLTVSVDPWRDTPARLRAYAKEFGANWPMLTGSLPMLKRFWSFFGVYFQKVPEEPPPNLDWWTGQPLTMDVNHTDGFILLDAQGHERFIDANAPNLHGKLRADLKKLLKSGRTEEPFKSEGHHLDPARRLGRVELAGRAEHTLTLTSLSELGTTGTRPCSGA